MTIARFAELFARSTDVYSAIKTVVAASAGGGDPINPADVVRELKTSYPDASLSPAELLEQVVRAAADAGIPLRVSIPDQSR